MIPALSVLGALWSRIRFPRWTFRQWLTVALLASAVGLIFALPIYHRNTVKRARSEGFNQGIAHADSLARAVIAGYVRDIAPLLAERDTAIARTDAALSDLAKAEDRYRRARTKLPLAMPLSPELKDALDAADALALATKPVLNVVLSERTAAKAIVVFDSTAIHALSRSLGIADAKVAQLTTDNRVLRTRVKQVGAGGVLLGVVGFFLGRN